MRRREFITLLSGAAAAWPIAVHAQDRRRRIGILTGGTDDPVERSRVAAFVEELRKLGWSEEKNLTIDIRWGLGDSTKIRSSAAELVSLAPDIIFVAGTSAMAPTMQIAGKLPIVFANVADPVGAGFVHSLAHPGGNVTGFLQLEYSLSEKWVELLKEVAPNVKRVAVLRDADLSTGIGQFAVIQAVAPRFGLEVIPINIVLDGKEIEQAIIEFASVPDGGIIQTPSGLGTVHRSLFVRLEAQYKLPTVCAFRFIAAAGALIAYGPDIEDQYRRAATYIDLIFKGKRPADLPVQAPTKYELVINNKTAKALGLTIPPALIARADEVIE